MHPAARPAPWAAALLALACLAAPARAQTASIDQVEEDWELVIDVPDPTGAGPQISTWLCPVADGSSHCFIFNLNYRELPSFAPGGLEVQTWLGDEMLTGGGKATTSLATTGETITWTQRMRLSGGVVSFAVDSGRSTTWGKFGQGQQLNVNASFNTTLTNLNGYSPDASVARSGVGWQPNRVRRMTLVRVRYYNGGKLIATVNTPKPVSLAY